MQGRSLARILGAGRAAFGVALFAMPSAIGRTWIGEGADSAGGKTAMRAVGARDFALGAGLLIALRRDAPARGWIEAGMLADVADMAGTLIAFRGLPPAGRFGVLAIAGGAAALGYAAARAIDVERSDIDAALTDADRWAVDAGTLAP